MAPKMERTILTLSKASMSSFRALALLPMPDRLVTELFASSSSSAEGDKSYFPQIPVQEHQNDVERKRKLKTDEDQ